MGSCSNNIFTRVRLTTPDSALTVLGVNQGRTRIASTWVQLQICRTVTMMTAGNDSRTSILIRAIYLLLLHPNALKKVQEELDHHVAKERIVNESDLKNLVYLEAAVKESLCLSPTTPLLALRESKEDCQVGGFYVPAGTSNGQLVEDTS
ncbi:hypothetical protein EJ110_NYTH21636 [Nymphaea thermarum]|nr:hypothetical protein EJ110_NYTH21636 [Nymphaea thermarum]